MSNIQQSDEANDAVEKHADLEGGNSTSVSPNASAESLTRHKEDEDEEGILKGLKLVTVVAALMLTILCVALDNTSQSSVKLCVHY